MNIIEKLGITPGPWRAEKGMSDWGMPTTIEIKTDHRRVATVETFTPYSMGESPSRLTEAKTDSLNSLVLSAAPEMLEALFWITDFIDTFEIERVSISHPNVDKYKNVIEKATGRTWAEIKELL